MRAFRLNVCTRGPRCETSHTGYANAFASRGAHAFRSPVSWLARSLVCLLILAPLVVFWQVHSHEFVLWDDPKNLLENPLGVALAKQGRLAEARQQFAEVLQLDPTHAAALQFLESSRQ
jgi:hypothetical protein